MEFLQALWAYITVSAPYLLLGLALSGVIKEFVPMDKVKKWLGKDDFASVTKASLVGVPLPLCSCSVIPTAVTLRKSGASKASTSSFLISTPESGVDSMAVTYALMDLPMTIIRPVAAFFSALLAGALQMVFNKETKVEADAPAVKEAVAASGSSCCPSSKPQTPVEEPKKEGCCGSGMKKETSKEPLSTKLKSSLRYGFSDLSDDIAFWLALGLIAGAFIQVLVPENFFQTLTMNESRLMILLVGVPLYICASATTPIAASLVLKGMSPGTALLLLLVGPATNASNIMVLQNYIGKKGVLLNVLAVVGAALLFSYLTDYLYLSYFKAEWAMNIAHEHEHPSVLSNVMGVFLSALIAKGIFNKKVVPWFEKKKAGSCCG